MIYECYLADNRSRVYAVLRTIQPLSLLYVTQIDLFTY